MALTQNEDERMLVNSVASFLDDCAPVSTFRAQRDRGVVEPCSELWSQMCELGLAGIGLPEAEGGSGAGLAAACLVAEQLGRVLAASPYGSTVVCVDLLNRLDQGTHRELIHGLVEGHTRLAIAFEESARHAPESLSLTCVSDGGGLRLNGRKRMVADGSAASHYVVVGRGEDGLLIVLLPKETAGLTAHRVDFIDSRDWVELEFADVFVPQSAILCRGETAEKAFARLLDYSRALYAFELLGIAQESFDRTVEYLGQREQFGVKIGSFQALQHRAARLYIALEVSRSVLMKAARGLDDECSGVDALVSLAKLSATQTARWVLDESIQMHGGAGVTDELDIGLFFKRVRTLGELYGDEAFHRQRLTRKKMTE